jgi:leader peptidase (prepilin peptidase) / N-methyltransferase
MSLIPVSPFSLSVAGLFGLVMGSAVTAIAHRVPRGISWFHGRSRCPGCGHVLAAWDLVPVLSWASALGRCRYCRAPVSPRYPLTELMCATWTVLLAMKAGFGVTFPLLAVWGYLMIALLWIDLDFQLLPDVLTFPGTLIGLAAAALVPGGSRMALGGVVMGSGLLWLLAWGYFKVRKIEGMGGGDVKLAAMFGVVLGWQGALLTLFLSALAGSLWGGILMARRQGDGLTAIPFGTLLAPASMVVFLWGDRWLNAYLGMFRG